MDTCGHEGVGVTECIFHFFDTMYFGPVPLNCLEYYGSGSHGLLFAGLSVRPTICTTGQLAGTMVPAPWSRYYFRFYFYFGPYFGPHFRPYFYGPYSQPYLSGVGWPYLSGVGWPYLSDVGMILIGCATLLYGLR